MLNPDSFAGTNPRTAARLALRDRTRTRAVVVTCLFAAACLSQGRVAATDSAGLPRSSLAQQGIDSTALMELVEKIRSGPYSTTHSLLIVRNGHLVLEEYFHDWSPDDLHEIQSLSKSVVSLAVGIALARGELSSIDQTMASFFPELAIANRDARKDAISIRHVLQMQTGTDYEEGAAGSPHSRLNRLREGWTQFWLDRPMLHTPGTRWRYDSGGVIALSSVFRSLTGRHVDTYVAQHLLVPLGITEWEWERNDEGHPHAGGGLHLRPRDLARIGQMILDGGRWKGRQLVPEAWIKESTAASYEFRVNADPFTGYGYLWWVMKPDPAVENGTPIIAATGLGGQYLIVIPDYEMVVVVTGWSRDYEDASGALRFLYDDVLPAVRK